MKQTKQTITIRANKEALDFIKQEADKLGISANAYINILFMKCMSPKEAAYDKESDRKD